MVFNPFIQQGTQAREKNEVLLQQFGIDYNTLPLMFRQGSSAFWNEVNFISLLKTKFSWYKMPYTLLMRM